MNRPEKADQNNVKDINNGNRGEDLTKSILRNISKSFCIKSIERVGINEYIYDDLSNCPNNLDDDVFIEKEKEFHDSYVPDHFAMSPGPSDVKVETFTFDPIETRSTLSEGTPKSDIYFDKSEDGEKAPEGRKKRANTLDVIDSLGDDYINLRRPETGGIAINAPRNRKSSDLGYSGSVTSTSSATSSSFPSQVYHIVRGSRISDVLDSKPFTTPYYGAKDVPEARMPVERDADEYNMYHPRRGRAIIINNDIFENNIATPRKGSLRDVEKLTDAFQSLDFEVTVFDNLNFFQIKEAVNAVSQEDHNDADCLIMAVLTHGMDNGLLYARDSLYPVDALWLPFTADKCLTLAGKPKLFFFQACRGEQLDPGVTLVSRKGSVSETDSCIPSYKLPSHSDFLIAYSAWNGHFSWRNPEDGTWFIQSLVQELNQNGTEANILDIMTKVNRRVAVQYSSYNEDAPWLHEQKQVPTFQSTLIRDLIFRPKNLK